MKRITMKRIAILQQRISALERPWAKSSAERFGGITAPIAQVLNLFANMSTASIAALEARLSTGAPTAEDIQFVGQVESAIRENRVNGLDARFLIEAVAEMEKAC